MNWNEIWSSILNFLQSGGLTILKLIGVFVVGYLAIRLAKILLRKILSKLKISTLIQKYVLNTVMFVLYFGLLLILLQMMGIQISALLAALAAAGLAVALALQDTLKSITNGIVLIVTKPFKENDYIKIDGVFGKVRAINFFTTTIDTFDNRRLIIPNKNMVNFTIENNTCHIQRRFSYEFKVSHKADISRLYEVVKNAILSNPNVYTKPEPTLLCKKIEENGVVFEARGWCPSEMPLYEKVEADVLQTLYNELKRNKIELASKEIVVYEQTLSAPYVDHTPLFQRDMTVEPTTNSKENLTFEEYLDGIETKTFQKLTRKQKKQSKNDQTKPKTEELSQKKLKKKQKKAE